MKCLSNALTRTILIAALSLAFAPIAIAQVIEEWIEIYDSPGGDDDEAYAMTVDGAGNVYVTGYSTNLAGYDQWLTIKYDTNGVEQWSATHSGTGGDDDYAYAIAVDGIGNVYAAGSAYNTGTRSDITTIKYDSNGIEQWAATYSGAGNRSDSANDIAVDGSGNVFVTGYAENASSNDDCVTIMYDANGAEQWVKVYAGAGNADDFGYALAVDGSSNVYVTGVAENASGDRDCFTVMYDSTGTEQWLTSYDGAFHGSDNGRDITLDGLGNVVITGSTEVSLNNYECLTVKYDSSGVEQWVKSYNGVEDEGASGFVIESDGSGVIHVAGYTRSTVTGLDFCTIQYDSSGVEQWVATYNGTANGNEGVNALAVDGSGNVYVTGDVENTGAGWDYATVKYNSLGVEQWAIAYNGAANDDERPYGLAVDGSGNVFVTGYSYNATGYVDWVTIKYAPGPVADIMANGDDGPLSVTTADLVEVTVALDPGSLDGDPADWWVLGEKDSSNTWWARYRPGQSPKWTKSVAPIRFAGATLRTVNGYTVLGPRTLPAGSYVFTFAVDDNKDDTYDGTFSDTVDVTVN